MTLLYALKGTWAAATFATSELVVSGQCAIAVVAVPALLTMWYATRQYARRRARESGPE